MFQFWQSKPSSSIFTRPSLSEAESEVFLKTCKKRLANKHTRKLFGCRMEVEVDTSTLISQNPVYLVFLVGIDSKSLKLSLGLDADEQVCMVKVTEAHMYKILDELSILHAGMEELWMTCSPDKLQFGDEDICIACMQLRPHVSFFETECGHRVCSDCLADWKWALSKISDCPVCHAFTGTPIPNDNAGWDKAVAYGTIEHLFKSGNPGTYGFKVIS